MFLNTMADWNQMHPSYSKIANTETLSSQAHAQFVLFNAVHFMLGAASEHRHIPSPDKWLTCT